jgi:hypothetical protein
MDVFELIAQFLDVADVDSQQIDLMGDPGGVEGLRVPAAAGRAEMRGVAAVFEGVGVAGRGAARRFFLGGVSMDMGQLLGMKELWYKYIIEYMF